jgi:SAM-dependent methyltransferase
MSDQPRTGQSEHAWSDYYQATARRPPRELYRQAVERFGPDDAGARLAIDLGCGSGIETADLLRRGWHVLAVDHEPEAIAHLLRRVPPEHHARLVTRVAAFDRLELPMADFVWAGLSLPFCPPAEFPAVWDRIKLALKTGGRFAGDLFGPRSAWASQGELTFLSREQVNALCQGLQVEHFAEEEGERQTALQGVQHWHGFSVVVRKP